MAQYDGAIRIATKITTKDAEESLASLEWQIKKSAKYMDELRSKMDTLKDQKIPTQEFKDLEKELQDSHSALNILLQKQKELESLGFKEQDIPKTLTDEIDKAGLKVGELEEKISKLNEIGKAFTLGQDSAEYKAYERQLQYEEEAVVKAAQHYKTLLKTSSGYKQLGGIASDSLKRIGKSIAKYATTPFKVLGNVAKSVFSNIGKSAKKSNGFLSTLGSRFKGLALSLLIFNQISKAFSAMISSMKEGFSNLYNDKGIPEFKNSVDSLKASALTLKNSFAAAFRPIVDVAIPYIQKLIDYMIQLMNVVGQFMAAITGQQKYTKAIKQTTAAIKSQNKAQNKQLSNLDNLNNLTSDTGAGADGGAGTMFEEAPIDSKWQDAAAKFKDILKSLKDMWTSADFTQLGKKVGTALKKMLNSIPWDSFKKKARQAASSLATFINGLVEVDKLGYSIGHTFAEAINTIFAFLNEFVHKLHWKSVGKFIAETFNGLFEGIDWKTIKDTFITGAKGLADAINSFTDWFHWDNISETISNGVNIITETLYTFFTETDFEELGQKLGEQLRKTIEKIDWEMLGRSIGSVIQAALNFISSFIGEQDFGEIAQAIFDTLKGIFETVDVGQLAEIILAALTVKLALKATASLFETAAGAILSGLGSALSSLTEKLFDISEIILNGIGTGITELGGIGGVLTADIGSTLSTGSFAAIGTTIGTAIIGGIIAAIAGWNFGQWLYEKITGEQIEMSFTEQVKEIFSSFTDGSWIEAFKLWGHDIVEGLKQGIMENFTAPSITSFIEDVLFGPFLRIFKALFGIHSPSTVMAEQGKYIVEGLLNGLKEKWKTVVDWITSKINWLTDKLSGITGKITSAFTGFGNSNDKTSAFSARTVNAPYTANPAFVTLSTTPIPKLATGAVIPANREFLAVLGDQKHGTNVEAPLSTIEEAVINAMAKVNANNANNGGGKVTIEIPVIIKGIGEIGRAVQQFDTEFFKQNGKHAFT